MRHPARQIPFDDLWDRLQQSKAAGLVREQQQGSLSLFCYTESCVYDRGWDDTTLMARGLIVDRERRELVATPFPKFFNLGENNGVLPDLPFETFEKVDGSLIIIFWHDGRWKCSTKGSLVSDQAAWASGWLGNCDWSHLTPGTTYLAEAVYPENRIVVRYDESGLILLSAYDEDGIEAPHSYIMDVASRIGWRTAERHACESVAELVSVAKALPATREGFVLRFSNGHRLKLKGEEYCRIHRMVSRLSPLSVWESMMNGDDLLSLRRQLPEEFWSDFDAIEAALNHELETLIRNVHDLALRHAGLSDKELGLAMPSISHPLKDLIFPHRKADGNLLTGRTRQHVFRRIRPDANVLPGYSPSSAINRFAEEAA